MDFITLSTVRLVLSLSEPYHSVIFNLTVRWILFKQQPLDGLHVI